MSTTTINSPSHAAVKSAADEVQSKFDLLTRRLRRDVWISGLLTVIATAVAMLLAAIISDAVLQPESTGLRVLLWIPVLIAVAVASYRFVWCPLRDHCHKLAVAWALEQRRPELQEGLTSTLLLADSNQPTAATLVDAVAAQANRDLTSCRDDAATRRDIQRPAIAAASCAVVAAFCFAVWPQYLIPSLSNVMAPWSARQLPYLNAVILPGDVAVSEGNVLEVSALGRGLDGCVLEIIDDSNVLSSTPMTVAATGKAANAVLSGLSTDQSYRIRSGSLVSAVYQITVYPRPVVTHAKATLQFPKYTNIPSATIDDLSDPFAAVPGTLVEISAASHIPISDTRFTFRDERQGSAETEQIECLWWHRWSLKVDEQPEQLGQIELVSDHGVSSELFSFEIQSVPDKPPTVSIQTPTLQHVTVSPDGQLPIQFEAADDFGVDCVEVMMQTQKAEPVPALFMKNLQAANHAAEYIFEPQKLGLNVGDEVALWLVASDNRSNDYGGFQTVESQRLNITIADDAMSVGQQQVIDEQNRILEALIGAIDNLHDARETAQQIADTTQQINADGVPADTNPDAQKLQQQLQSARQALENATDSNKESAALFETEKQQIRNIADNEVEEAKQQARKIPLMDDQARQQQAANAARSAVEQAEQQLATLKSQIEDRAGKLQQAAELDELARQQNELARQMQDQQPALQQADPKQEKIANTLQELVRNDPEAESEQFLQRAETAEQLAEKTSQLQQQQQQLTNAAENKTDQETRQQLAQMIQTEQQALAAENQQLMKGAEQNEANPANKKAAADAQQLMEQVANDLAEQNLKAAEQNAEDAKQKLQEAATPRDAANGAVQKQPTQTKPEEQHRLAERQERVEQAIRAVKENDFEAAADKLQQLITDRLQQVSEEADELLDLPTDDEDNQQAGNNAQQKLKEALKESKQASAKPQDKQPSRPADETQQQAGTQSQKQQPGEQDQKGVQPEAQKQANQKDDAAGQSDGAGQNDTQPQQQAKAGQQEADSKAKQQPGQQDQKNGEPQAQKQGNQKDDVAGQPDEAGQKDAQPQQHAEAGQQKADSKAKQQPGQQDQKSNQPQAQPKNQQQPDNQEQKQDKAAESLKKATESLQQFCKSCRKCANCDKPGQSGSSPGGSSKPSSKPSGSKLPEGKPSEQDGPKKSGVAKQLAKTTDDAQKAARNPTPDSAKELAKELDQLADDAAINSDYPRRKGNTPESSRDQRGTEQAQSGAGKKGQNPGGKGSPSSEPMGVGRESGPNDVGTTATQLRGPSTSEWTRSQKRLRGNVLDSKSAQIPDGYRNIVEDYFQQLAKLQSDEETEASEVSQ